MRVIDFFCGAGGFSEGFRQAGFEVIWAVDIWQPAVDTHTANHPTAATIKGDVIKISQLPDIEFEALVPDSEVIIGSPPCTAFSNSNKSGKADKAKGIALIEAYLRIVARKKFKRNSILKYWILENVPKVDNHIKDIYTAKNLGLSGNWTLPVKNHNTGIYNAKYYGVPSNRPRFFCGEFPKPTKVIEQENSLIPLSQITAALGTPKEKLHTNIADPLYQLELHGEEVTDHHYVQQLAEFEVAKAKRLKQDKGYMGKMCFPESETKPARTIMATISMSARESFILGYGDNSYRAPTIREVASLMSFPIDYRFYAPSIGTKYKLVGNSVPPLISYAFAKAIFQNENLQFNINYAPIVHNKELDFVNLNLDEFHINKEKKKKPAAKFKYHIPYFKYNAYRVELTNYHSKFEKEEYHWHAEIHYSQGPRAELCRPDLRQFRLKQRDLKIATQFMKTLKKNYSASRWQELFRMTEVERKINHDIGPYELLESIRSFVLSNYTFSNEDLWTPISCKGFKAVPRPIIIGYYILYKSLKSMKVN